MQFSKCCDSEVLWWPFRVLHAKLRYEFCLENICFFATRYVYKNATLLVLGEDKLHIIVLQIGYSLSLKIWFHIKKTVWGKLLSILCSKGEFLVSASGKNLVVSWNFFRIKILHTAHSSEKRGKCLIKCCRKTSMLMLLYIF